MAFFGQIYRNTILTPFIVLTAIPALIIAMITTSLALLTLFLRTFTLGVNLALRFMPYYLSKPNTKSIVARPQLKLKVSLNSISKQRRQASSTSSRAVTPSSALSFNLGLDASRDYEGVGGWQLSETPDEEGILCINSRLQLPGNHGRQRLLSSPSKEVSHLQH